MLAGKTIIVTVPLAVTLERQADGTYVPVDVQTKEIDPMEQFLVESNGLGYTQDLEPAAEIAAQNVGNTAVHFLKEFVFSNNGKPTSGSDTAG